MPRDRSPLRLIWITPKFPLGIPDGARHATCQLLQHLSRLNVTIDLICLVPRGEATDAAAATRQLGVRSCSTISRSRSRFWPLPHWRVPFTFRTFTAEAVRRSLAKCLADLLTTRSFTAPPLLVFDGLHTFGALHPNQLQDLARRCGGIVYRAHNVETVLWAQCADSARTPWMRRFFRYQTDLVRRFEREIVRNVTWIAAVSEDDARRFKQLVPGAPAGSTPIGMDFPDDPTITSVVERPSFELLFVGRLDWLPNRTGLQWFLEKIWPGAVTRRRDLRLKIAGSGTSGWLRTYRHLPGVEILGRVPDVSPLYRSCVLSVAPVFQGSGTRVKILEAARYKRAVLSTALGVEGIGLVAGQSYFQAETAVDWARALETLTLDDCRQAGLQAFDSVRERFDGKTLADQFLKRLTDCCAAPTVYAHHGSH